MRRIFSDFAYGPGPRSGCWWDETAKLPERDALKGAIDVDVAVIGAGFTGLSAALTLAEGGARVAVVEAQHVGWGASGRNGGFCCLGGSKADDTELDRKFGKDARLAYRQAEVQAVQHVSSVLERFGIDADRHSNGETALAHRPKDMQEMQCSAFAIVENYGVEPVFHEKGDLAAAGMGAEGVFGAMTVPIGFGLNPRKYVAGLAAAAETAGALIFEKSPVDRIRRQDGKWIVCVHGAEVSAAQTIVATNGYSSENLPDWLKARYLPTQSNVLVTRPLSDAELQAQGWFTDQMSYDTRNMVHYFRLMPDRRFLFGMRGTIQSSPQAERRARANTRRHFERMFPNWSHVEASHTWSGMVCLAFNKVPYVGAVPEQPGMWVAMCYHGNGVAMGSYSGRLVAEMAANGQSVDCPSVMEHPMRRFPLGSARRALVPPLYASLMWQDR